MLSPAAARHIEFAALSTKHAAAMVELVGAYRHLQEQLIVKDAKLVEITREHEDAINKKEESKAIAASSTPSLPPAYMYVLSVRHPTHRACVSGLRLLTLAPPLHLLLLPIAVTMQIKLMGDQICGMRAREESKADGFKQTIDATDAKVGSSGGELAPHASHPLH